MGDSRAVQKWNWWGVEGLSSVATTRPTGGGFRGTIGCSPAAEGNAVAHFAQLAFAPRRIPSELGGDQIGAFLERLGTGIAHGGEAGAAEGRIGQLADHLV